MKRGRKFGFKLSKEAKLKHSIQMKGRKFPNRKRLSKEDCLKMSLRRKGRKGFFKGHHHTEATKKLISKMKKGTHHDVWWGIPVSPYSGIKYGKHPHRWIMEMLLNRKLKNTEHIHHIDGEHKNNSLYPMNLQIITNSEHQILHKIGKHRSKKIRDRISETLKSKHLKPHNYGIPMTKEAKANLSRIAKKQYRTFGRFAVHK